MKSHGEEIDVTSWGWGEVWRGEGASGKGTVAMENVKFLAVIGSHSTQLMLYCATGKKLKSAVLTCEKLHGTQAFVFLTITLTDVTVASHEISAEPHSALPYDHFELKYSKIEFKYVSTKTDGSEGSNFTSSWDLSQNKS